MLETILIMLLQGVVTAITILSLSSLLNLIRRRSIAKAWNTYLTSRFTAESEVTPDKSKKYEVH